MAEVRPDVQAVCAEHRKPLSLVGGSREDPIYYCPEPQCQVAIRLFVDPVRVNAPLRPIPLG